MRLQQVAVAALFAGAIAAPSQGKGKQDYSVDKNYQKNEAGDVMYCKGGWEMAEKGNGNNNNDVGAAGKGSQKGNQGHNKYQLKRRVKWIKNEVERLWGERQQAHDRWQQKKNVSCDDLGFLRIVANRHDRPGSTRKILAATTSTRRSRRWMRLRMTTRTRSSKLYIEEPDTSNV